MASPYPPARQPSQQVVSEFRKKITFTDNGKVVVVGTIPAGALILKPLSGVQVATAFNAGTANVLDIGHLADDDFFATDLALGTVTFVPLDELVTMKVTSDTTIIATPALSGTAATAGEADVVICFIAAEG